MARTNKNLSSAEKILKAINEYNTTKTNTRTNTSKKRNLRV